MKTNDAAANRFPFKTTPSLRPLIEFWEQMARDRDCADVGFVSRLQEEIAKVPELLHPLHDLSIIQRHRSLVDAMMTAIFPPASWESDLTCAITPFDFNIFYSTPQFRQMMMDAEGRFHVNFTMSEKVFQNGKLINAFVIILQKFYGMNVSLEYPIIASVEDPEAGFECFFRIRFDTRFVDIRATQPVQPLTDEQRRTVLANLTSPDVLSSIIPTSNFEFYGFVIINAVGVTDQETLSSLKHDLIERESLMTMERFLGLERKVQSLLRRKDVRLGLAALPPRNMGYNYGRKIGYSFIFDERCSAACESVGSSPYGATLDNKQVTIIEDLAVTKGRSAIESELYKIGIRTLGLAPLMYQGEAVGILELCSETAGAITPLSFMKLSEVLSLFGMAIKRSNDELDNIVQAVIKEKCTAIHPSVEWRFRHAAMRLIEEEKSDKYATMEPIIFENVYPLYGLSDIRGSSTQRNTSIQADLIAHLALARDVVMTASQARPLPFLDEMSYRIGSMTAMIRQGVSSGDEVSILDFLHRDVEQLFPHLREFSDTAEEKIRAYHAAMDPQMGFLYQTRKDFEESVTLINETISSYLDEEQEKAQQMFPHYFEKYKTDGVDHGIYVGGSLVEGRAFDILYLKNLRLWQLIVMCGVVAKTRAIKDQLKVPLDTAHLILVQDQPLSIRFRFDEKKFDVDGAYNIRYEIMKKRIDKATLKGSEERLTQPGKIAVVYSQQREANEYKRYLEYLHARGYLLKEVEQLELEDLQGIQGLRALRVTASTAPPAGKEIRTDDVDHAVRSAAQLRN